jgi:hypothetical protein
MKLFFVGRRGAGKTAITINLTRKNRRVIELIPQSFDLLKLPLAYDEFRDTRQRPFKSLVSAFERALLHECCASDEKAAWRFGLTTICREKGKT